MSFRTYADSTARRRKTEYNTHIKPFFGQMKIKDVETKHVIEFRQYLVDTFNSVNTAIRVYSSFKILINHAMRFFNMRSNPTLMITPFKRKKSNQNYIKREEFDRNVNKIENLYYKELVILMFYTGLRVGEAMALKWKYVNFDEQGLFVRHTLDLQTKKIGSPKTESSNAFVPFPKHISKMLLEIKKESKEKIYGFDDEHFVFGGKNPYTYTPLLKRFRLAFPNLRLHDLRHSYASYLINKGVDIYLVKELMRHTNIKQTTDTYGHLYIERKQDAMKVFDD